MNASLKLSDELYARIGRLAERRKRSAHSLMLEAVGEYVERAEVRETYLQEAREAWQHYQDTGLHLTQAEVQAWLKRMAGGEQAELPACRP